MNTPTEVRINSADGGSLGLFSLALVTLVGSSGLFGMTPDPNAAAWILCLGAFAQILAAFIGFKSGNIFGGTVFGGYGLFWLGMGCRELFISGFFGEAGQASMTAGASTEMALVCLGYLIFSIMMFIASLETNKMLAIVVGLIVLLFFGLTLTFFGASGIGGMIANLSRIVLSVVSFYGAGAVIFNTMFGREFWPVGKPLGKFVK
jgi:succinate-acetate transporter protein